MTEPKIYQFTLRACTIMPPAQEVKEVGNQVVVASALLSGLNIG